MSLAVVYIFIFSLHLLVVGGDVSQETVDSAAVFLFSLFSSDPEWTRSHAEEIRRTLGPYPASAATRACNGVIRVLSYMPENWPGLKTDLHKTTAKSSTTQSSKPTKEFGHNIKFKHITNSPASHISSKSSQDSTLPPASPSATSGYDSLSDNESAEESTRRSNVVTSTLLNGMQQTSMAASRTSADVSGVPGGLGEGGRGAGASVVSLYSASWLKEQCQLCARGSSLSWQDIYSAVFEHLSSTGDNTAIQNDVSLKLYFKLT